MGRTKPALAHPEPVKAGAAELCDLRFSALLGAEAWVQLPAAVRARFSHRYVPGQSVSYSGTVEECRMSRAGWLLAQLCRAIGAPLPLERGGGQAAVVTVTEHGPSGGQVWTRVYARRNGFPQVIHSAKQFAGPTGLEEYLGLGIGIALRVQANGEGIAFLNDHYFIRFGKWHLRLPRWLEPGHLRIDHIDRGEGWFSFILNLNHPLLGELIHQAALFRDRPDIAQ